MRKMRRISGVMHITFECTHSLARTGVVSSQRAWLRPSLFSHVCGFPALNGMWREGILLSNKWPVLWGSRCQWNVWSGVTTKLLSISLPLHFKPQFLLCWPDSVDGISDQSRADAAANHELKLPLSFYRFTVSYRTLRRFFPFSFRTAMSAPSNFHDKKYVWDTKKEKKRKPKWPNKGKYSSVSVKRGSHDRKEKRPKFEQQLQNSSG